MHFALNHMSCCQQRLVSMPTRLQHRGKKIKAGNIWKMSVLISATYNEKHGTTSVCQRHPIYGGKILQYNCLTMHDTLFEGRGCFLDLNPIPEKACRKKELICFLHSVIPRETSTFLWHEPFHKLLNFLHRLQSETGAYPFPLCTFSFTCGPAKPHL